MPTGEKIRNQANFRDLRADLNNMNQLQNHNKNNPKVHPIAAWPGRMNGITKCLTSFSIYTNTQDVLKAEHAPGDLACLHGIRVISILWVILGHIYYFLPQIGNILTLAEMTKWWTFHAILNAPYAVDTFFTISGCLVAYLFLRTVKKAGGLKPPHMVMFYVHRYLRLTPLYALAILIYHGITPYIEEGPFQWENVEDRGENCRDLWWTNLLYFSNMRRDFRQCMGWSWYLPNDMQFYAVAPVVLIPLALGYQYLGLLVAFLQVALHLIMYTVMVEKYDANIIRGSLDYFIHIYIKPYTRCGPYAIGLALGYFLFKTKSKFKMPKALVALGWLLAIGGGLTLVYVTHDNLKEFSIVNPTWSDNQMNALDIVSKPLWALCIAWVILACVNGYGGVINSILSWTAWVPLSRLTFGTYLIHPMVIFYFNNNRRTVAYFTYHFVIERFLATALLSFAIAYVLNMLIETPVRNLIKPSRKPKAAETSSRHCPSQDTKLTALSMASHNRFGGLRADALRNRNVYLPGDAESRFPSLDQTEGSTEPFPSSHIMSAGRGLYPSIPSDAQETKGLNREVVAKSLTKQGVAFDFETVTKTVSFDEEEPVVINPVYVSLIDQPDSPTKQIGPLQQHKHFQQQGSDAQRSSYLAPISTAESFPQALKAETSPSSISTEPSASNRMKELVSLPSEKSKADLGTNSNFSSQPPLLYPDASSFFTTIATLEDPLSNRLVGLEVGGIVNKTYEHDNKDIVQALPSAPPETPESGRSEKTHK
ncbi:nose resistant to fluoxetine protein 6-like [Plakobranchus ocellatus]|uniref:Nose resistant to fluoxetine protein 6-like n=1 Tax=Plakobranchus ocellatus TaxID=259542 RepID=A0AAV4BVH8_9GAST|nr:nose resistant to fluoxetine protein 6-like [Plakobranchus ocellatus]